MAIYGIIIAIILQGKLSSKLLIEGSEVATAQVTFSGYVAFATGITVGLGNLSCGYAPPASPLSPLLLSLPTPFLLLFSFLV